MTLRFVLCVFLAGCAGGLQALYPPRPQSQPQPMRSDPAPSKLVIHVSILRPALEKLLDEQIPKGGNEAYAVLGATSFIRWSRGPVATSFRQNRIAAQTELTATIDSPIGSMTLPLRLTLDAEPVVTSDYKARLQAAEVQVSSTDTRLRLAQGVGGALDKLKALIDAKIRNFAYDLRPLVLEAYGRTAKPIPFQVGDSQGCAELRVLGVEAGPTILADGIEKDIALVIAPSVKLPCDANPAPPPPLPPLANVAYLATGPFSVSLPIVARYDELSRAMTQAFTNGKLFFAKDDPELYLEKPEIYPYRDQLVVKLHLHGPIHRGSIRTTLDGNLYLIGRPQLIDNELSVPDLEPTLETANFLLQLKAALDGESIRRQARQALRLDLGERLTVVRNKLSTDLGFGSGQGCLRSQVNRIEVAQVFTHAQYLRLYLTVSGQGSLYLPCPATPIASPQP